MPSRSRYVSQVMPTGQVRDTRSYTTFGTRPVELVTSDIRGDEIEGRMQVPDRLAYAKPHTNEHLELQQYIADQLKRWVEWREHMGWRLNSQPNVKGPCDPMVESPEAEMPDWKLYFVHAFFKPIKPILAGFEDVIEQERKAAMYGVDLWAPKPYSSLQGQRTKQVIYDSRPFEDPMVIAEQRRQQYGMQRKDLLIGKLSDPWEEPK